MGRPSRVAALIALALLASCASPVRVIPLAAYESIDKIKSKRPADVRVFRSDQLPADLPDAVPVARFSLGSAAHGGRSAVQTVKKKAAHQGVDIVILQLGETRVEMENAGLFLAIGIWAFLPTKRSSGAGVALIRTPSRMPVRWIHPETVADLLPGAQTDNVLPGDRLLEFNGVPVQSGELAAESPHHAERLRIEPGTRVPVRMLRPGVGIVEGSMVAIDNPPTHLDATEWDGSKRLARRPDEEMQRGGSVVWRNSEPSSESR